MLRHQPCCRDFLEPGGDPLYLGRWLVPVVGCLASVTFLVSWRVDASVRVDRSQCREIAQARMERISTLMEPAMVLILGFSVGFIVLAILTPVFDLAGIVK